MAYSWGYRGISLTNEWRWENHRKKSMKPGDLDIKNHDTMGV